MDGAAEGLGTVATGGLIAREIERAHAGLPAVGHDVHEACANCGAIRQGAYCHECGQAGHVHRNLHALLHDVAHGVFHFEGKIWKTLPLLAWRPGQLTRRYVQGERAKFVSPMALFLFSIFLMFAVVSNLAGLSTSNGRTDAPKAAAVMTAERTKAETELRALEVTRAAAIDDATRRGLDKRLTEARADLVQMRNLEAISRAGAEAMTHGAAGDYSRDANGKPWQGKINTKWKWFDHAANNAARDPELALYKIKSYGYKYSWALIPISLPFIWLLFAFRRDVGLYDHAIFATYSLAFMSLAVVVLTLLSAIGVPSSLIALAAMIVPPVHMYRQLKGAYSLGWIGASWRTCALLVITTITSMLFLAFLFYLGSH